MLTLLGISYKNLFFLPIVLQKAPGVKLQRKRHHPLGLTCSAVNRRISIFKNLIRRDNQMSKKLARIKSTIKIVTPDLLLLKPENAGSKLETLFFSSLLNGFVQLGELHEGRPADPSNAGWQRDLWVSYWRMADMLERSGKKEAIDWWRRAYAVLSSMRQKGLFISPGDAKFLDILRRKCGI